MDEIGGQDYIIGDGGDTCLHLVLTTGDDEILKLLVNSGKADLNVLHQGRTVLGLALLSQNKAAVELFLSRGINSTAGQPDVCASTCLEGGHMSPEPAEICNLARQHLSIVTSNRLVPPQELREVYHNILSLESLSDVSLWKAANASDLIQSVLEGLYKVANVQRVSKLTKFCLGCREFQSNLLHTQKTDIGALLDVEASRTKLHDNREQLNECASQGCLLCGQAADALDKDGSTKNFKGPSNDEVSIALGSIAGNFPSSKWGKFLHIRCAGSSADLSIGQLLEGIEGSLGDSVLEDLTTGSPQALGVARY
ncbi:hypothetical protein DL95DRAFT_469439 [Leptodontidium sp. 2 PMI_412]|nr:hypothetical protein DL95DRAFT_469439 [Leptodontidium sp. 2 PMI_412]